MTARSERSQKRESQTPQARGEDGGDIGWGLVSEDSEEDIGRRKIVFTISVALVACVGVWILLTAAANDGGSHPLLVADGSQGQGRLFYTVKLLEFGGSEREWAQRIVSMDNMRDLAGEHDYEIFKAANGKWVLCVGQFARQDSEELTELLRSVQDFESPGGGRLFQSAIICRRRE